MGISSLAVQSSGPVTYVVGLFCYQCTRRVALSLPGAGWHIPVKELEDYWKQDLPGAKKLLADAGYPNGLAVELTSKLAGTQSSIAELIVAQVAKAGFRAKIKTIDNVIYANNVLTAGQFQVYNGTALASAEPNVDLYRFYYSSSSTNVAGVNDSQLDKMIDQQRRTFNPEERRKLLKDIQWYIVKNAWYPALHFTRPQTVVQKSVRNYNPMCCYDYGVYETTWFDK